LDTPSYASLINFVM